MDDHLRNLTRAAARGDEASRARLQLEFERLGPAAYPFRGVEQPPPPACAGDDDPLLTENNPRKCGAEWVWETRTRRAAEARRDAKSRGHRRHRTRIRQSLRTWSRDPQDYC